MSGYLQNTSLVPKMEEVKLRFYSFSAKCSVPSLKPRYTQKSFMLEKLSLNNKLCKALRYVGINCFELSLSSRM